MLSTSFSLSMLIFPILNLSAPDISSEHSPNIFVARASSFMNSVTKLLQAVFMPALSIAMRRRLIAFIPLSASFACAEWPVTVRLPASFLYSNPRLSSAAASSSALSELYVIDEGTELYASPPETFMPETAFAVRSTWSRPFSANMSGKLASGVKP